MSKGRKMAFLFYVPWFVFLLLSPFFMCGEAAAVMPPLPLRCSAPEWLQRSIHGSMNAVWRELMGSRVSRQTALEALGLVASRLFNGYSVRINTEKIVVIQPERDYRWSIIFAEPEGVERIPDECRSWLREDLSTLRPLIGGLLENVPPEALQWSSDSFKTQIDSLLLKYFPGWRVALRIQANANDARLELKFYPKTPLLLAFSVETLSNTIPQLLADRMSDKSLEYLSPLTGFPLEWLTFHKDSLLKWLGAQQLNWNGIEFLNASVDNTVSFKTVTKVTTRFDSSDYSLRGWVSVHAGNDSRFQAGVHFGRFLKFWPNVPFEFYAEGIIGLERWKLDGRLGISFSPFRYVWMGIEGSTEDEAPLWYRLKFDVGRSGYYGWLRYSKNNDLEAAFGYRVNRYVSLELYYENKQKERFSLRALGNL